MSKKDKHHRYREVAKKIVNSKLEGSEITKFSEFNRDEAKIILGYLMELVDNWKTKIRINELFNTVENEIIGYDSRILLASILVIVEPI